MDKKLTLFIGALALFACKTNKNCLGDPKPDMVCIQIFDPVCGCNGKTYGNSCTAEAAGVLKWRKGECN